MDFAQVKGETALYGIDIVQVYTLDVHQTVQVKFTQNPKLLKLWVLYIYICMYLSLKVLVLAHHCVEKQKACINLSLYYLTIYSLRL